MQYVPLSFFAKRKKIVMMQNLIVTAAVARRNYMYFRENFQTFAHTDLCNTTLANHHTIEIWIILWDASNMHGSLCLRGHLYMYM